MTQMNQSRARCADARARKRRNVFTVPSNNNSSYPRLGPALSADVLRLAPATGGWDIR
jgi:hypothetical protein